jgi:general secretion pathway protein N
MNARTAQQLTYGLAGLCGVLGLFAILAWMGAGRGYSWLADSGEPEPVTGVGRIDAGQVSIPPEAQFAEIQQRPIFNEDRKPTPPAPPDKPGEEVKAVPLNITLTGIVLAPSARLAMVQDNAKNEAVTLRVGMPLPGDQQVWTLSEIKNRSVVFKNQSDETAEVELQVAAVAAVAPAQSRLPTPPPPPPPVQPTAASPPPPNVNANASAQPADRAAELQRRIEERRREMREQAEKLRQQQDQNKNSE